MAKEPKSAEKPTVMLVVKNQPDKPANAALQKLAAKGWDLAEAKSVADAELKGVNEKLHESVEPGTALLVEGKFRATVSEALSYSIPDHKPLKALLGTADFNKMVIRNDTLVVKDAKALKKALGAAKFKELIDVETKYLPSPELIEWADMPNKLGKDLRPLFDLTTKKSVRWLAQKPKAGTVSVKAAAVAVLMLGAGLFFGVGSADAHPSGALRIALEHLSEYEFPELSHGKRIEDAIAPLNTEPAVVCSQFEYMTESGSSETYWQCYGTADGEADG